MIESKTLIIDGKAIASVICEEIQQEIAALICSSAAPPKLAIVLVATDPASEIYVRNKMIAARKIGIEVELLRFSADVSNRELMCKLEQLNLSEDISGIIVQLPLPRHLDKDGIIQAIDPEKDLDGFHLRNIGALYSGTEPKFIACTALACLHLIKITQARLIGAHAVIIGRSNIVGKPLAALLLNNDCTVTIAHSKTTNLKELCHDADIVVSAVGRPKFLTKEYFNKKAVIIDVGITRITEQGTSKIVGDVDFQDVRGYVNAITPVPGGVGPMTVAFLLSNCLKAHRSKLRMRRY